MATLQQIRVALADQVNDTIDGLSGEPNWPDTIEPPVFIPMPDLGHYHQAMGDPGHSDITIDAFVLVAPAHTGATRAHELLDQYLDPTGDKSLKAAIEANKTLGGLITTLVVKRWHDYGIIEDGGIEWWGAKLEIEVYP